MTRVLLETQNQAHHAGMYPYNTTLAAAREETVLHMRQLAVRVHVSYSVFYCTIGGLPEIRFEHPLAGNWLALHLLPLDRSDEYVFV
jgi:hypothetical protein